MKDLHSGTLLHALLVCSGLMAACTSPGYNNNPSQQMTNARIGCPAATEFFAVYFSVHVQPPLENQDEKITKELFRSYCQDIPTLGKVFFTADLVGSELRKIPIGIRVVEQAFPDGGENNADNSNDLITVSEFPPKTYSKGAIEIQFELDKSGYYAVYLIRNGRDAISKEDELRIPLNVGIESGIKRLLTRLPIFLGIATGLALIVFVAFRFMRQRKVI